VRINNTYNYHSDDNTQIKYLHIEPIYIQGQEIFTLHKLWTDGCPFPLENINKILPMLSPNSNILGINQFLSDILSNLAQRTMFVVMRPGTNLDQVWQHCPLLLVVWPFSFPIYKTM